MKVLLFTRSSGVYFGIYFNFSSLRIIDLYDFSMNRAREDEDDSSIFLACDHFHNHEETLFDFCFFFLLLFFLLY